MVFISTAGGQGISAGFVEWNVEVQKMARVIFSKEWGTVF